jgi:hypothetical protein
MSNPKFIWLAVDANGDERISSNPEGFQRFCVKKYHEGDPEECSKTISFNDAQTPHDHWIERHDGESPKTGFYPQWMFLPAGTIKKILGRELTWDDAPVKLEEGAKSEIEERAYQLYPVKRGAYGHDINAPKRFAYIQGANDILKKNEETKEEK